DPFVRAAAGHRTTNGPVIHPGAPDSERDHSCRAVAWIAVPVALRAFPAGRRNETCAVLLQPGDRVAAFGRPSRLLLGRLQLHLRARARQLYAQHHELRPIVRRACGDTRPPTLERRSELPARSVLLVRRQELG